MNELVSTFFNVNFTSFQIISVLAITFLAALIKTGFGVGAGIFISSTLCLIMPSKAAIAFGGLVMLSTNLLPFYHYWKSVHKRTLLIVIAGSIAGMVVGGLVINYTPQEWFTKLVGLFCIIFAVHQLVGAYVRRYVKKTEGKGFSEPHKVQGLLLGMLGGTATVIAHAGGVIYSIYMLSLGLSKDAFVGTMVSIFFMQDRFKNLIYWKINLLTPDMLLLLVCAIPSMVVGNFAGYAIHKRISSKVFERLILGFVIAVSIRLMVFSG